MNAVLFALLALMPMAAHADTKAEKAHERQCMQYLSNMESTLSHLDTKDLIRYSAQMANFDAWKWPYFAKRCSADKYADLLHRHSSQMNKVHSNWR